MNTTLALTYDRVPQKSIDKIYVIVFMMNMMKVESIFKKQTW